MAGVFLRSTWAPWNDRGVHLERDITNLLDEIDERLTRLEALEFAY